MEYLTKNEIKSAKRTPHLYIYEPPFPEILDPPLISWFWVQTNVALAHLTKLGWLIT